MKIIQMKLSELKEYENNPRLNDNAVDKVAKSIKEFGFKVPIIVDKNNVIIAGHTRKKASELLNLETVPVIVSDDLNEEQVKAFRLADNKVAEFSEWDFEKLEIELEELNNLEFDMNILGFLESYEDDEEATEEYELDDISDVEVIIIEPENHNELEAQFNKLQKEGYNCRISTL